MNIRNLWKRAYNEGRYNDIPEEVRAEVVKILDAKSGKKSPIEAKFSQFVDEELEDLADHKG